MLCSFILKYLSVIPEYLRNIKTGTMIVMIPINIVIYAKTESMISHAEPKCLSFQSGDLVICYFILRKAPKDNSKKPSINSFFDLSTKSNV